MIKRVRNKQYHEIDHVELAGTRIAARSTGKLRNKLIEGFKQKKIVDISNDLVFDMLLPLITASIVSDLKGRRRSFHFADESFNLEEADLTLAIELAFEDLNIKRHVKRVFRVPVKKNIKKGLRIAIEGVPETEEEEKGLERINNIYQKGKKAYKGGEKLKRQIEKTPIQFVGKKARVKPVPSPAPLSRYSSKRRIKFQEQLNREQERIKEEIRQKLKGEKKYLYDEVVRHLRVILKDVTVATVKVVNWQEVYDRLLNDERNLNDVKALIKHDVYNEKGKLVEKGVEYYQAKLLTKLINKVTRKIRDKKERAKEELKKKAAKEVVRVGREYVLKPIKKPIEQKISEKLFGTPRKAGSHRQYRSQYYYIAKSLQELEKGQKRRRQVETGKHILSSLGGIADLIGFLAEYNIKDVFVFLSELGGASFFPETYKIGGIVKAANYVGDVGHIFELLEEDAEFNVVREYQIKRALRLIQELQTIKKLFSRYYPPVFKILKNASQKTNDNLRQVINNLILSGTPIPEGTAILKEAFAINGLSIKDPFKIETIFRTQSALAYSAGRWQSDSHPAIQEILWGYKYVTVGDSRVRKEHRVLDGVTLPKEDEFWMYFWPPNGWNCRCSVISIFEPVSIVEPPSDWRGLAEIDGDFAFNAGEVFTESPAHFAGIR